MLDKVGGGFILTPLQADMINWIICVKDDLVSGYSFQMWFHGNNTYSDRLHDLWERKLLVDYQPKLNQDLIGVSLAGRWALTVYEWQVRQEARYTRWDMIPMPNYLRKTFYKST
jgi:hypothetical protein